jgi:hypothetical protein
VVFLILLHKQKKYYSDFIFKLRGSLVPPRSTEILSPFASIELYINLHFTKHLIIALNGAFSTLHWKECSSMVRVFKRIFVVAQHIIHLLGIYYVFLEDE